MCTFRVKSYSLQHPSGCDVFLKNSRGLMSQIPVSFSLHHGKGKGQWGNSLFGKPGSDCVRGRSSTINQPHKALELSVTAKLAFRMKICIQSVFQLVFLVLCCVLMTGKKLISKHTCIFFYYKIVKVFGFSSVAEHVKPSVTSSQAHVAPHIALTCNPVCAARESDGTFVPGRCLCPQTQDRIRGQPKELTVHQRSPSCDKVTVM